MWCVHSCLFVQHIAASSGLSDSFSPKNMPTAPHRHIMQGLILRKPASFGSFSDQQMPRDIPIVMFAATNIIPYSVTPMLVLTDRGAYLSK